MRLPDCPDVVRAYHEAGHAALNLVFGYGLALCSIEAQADGNGGVTQRIATHIAAAHYALIKAGGPYAERYSGHDFETAPCEDGGQSDYEDLDALLLETFEVPEHERDPRSLTAERKQEIENLLKMGHQLILEKLEQELETPGRIDLIHEVAQLLLAHRSLPSHVLTELNGRFPVR